MSLAFVPAQSATSRRSAGAAMVVRVPRSVAAPVPSASVYRRRRAVVAVFVAALVGVIGLAAGGGEASRTVPQGPGMRSYLVQPGDTLWAIAGLHAGSMPMADYVAVLVEVNGGAQIRAGEWIVLP